VPGRGAKRLADRRRLHRPRVARPCRPAAGGLRLAGGAAPGRRPGPAHAAPPLTGRPAGPGHAGSGKLLAERVLPGEDGHPGQLPEAFLAGGPSDGVGDAARAAAGAWRILTSTPPITLTPRILM